MTSRGADYARIAGDNYNTPRYVVREFLAEFGEQLPRVLCDPAPGRGNMLKEFEHAGKVPLGNPKRRDFITDDWWWPKASPTIFTNPPYGDRRGSLAVKFVERALELTGLYCGSVVMLLPFDFDAAKGRRHLFEHRAFVGKVVIPRIKWFDNKAGSTTHAWYFWDWAHRGQPWIKYRLGSTDGTIRRTRMDDDRTRDRAGAARAVAGDSARRRRTNNRLSGRVVPAD